jgi:tetratricopeptide (TPR) repeat protein
VNQLDLGEKEDALHWVHEALSLFEATDSKPEEEIALHQIGRAYWALGEREKVLDYFQRALEIHRAMGDQVGEARTLSSIATFFTTSMTIIGR